jgi:hypothetical protein
MLCRAATGYEWSSFIPTCTFPQKLANFYSLWTFRNLRNAHLKRPPSNANMSNTTRLEIHAFKRL